MDQSELQYPQDQIPELRSWADLREQEGIAFGILGDFNRRFAVKDDRTWKILSPGSSPLELLTADIKYDCAPRFKEFIDHIVLDADAAALLVPNSTREWLRDTLHPDHCAVSADLQMLPTSLRKPAAASERNVRRRKDRLGGAVAEQGHRRDGLTGD